MAVQLLKAGDLSLPALLERDDDVAKTLVRRLFDSLPGIGKVHSRQLLVELGIAAA
ncbi:hypothetical protein ACIOFV_52490 [Streptomyces mirabilis]|uniref:hypothetical protein n=1 Tax=Streptomyces mirabilis TaxID=68239 RepID=UPI003825BC66